MVCIYKLHLQKFSMLTLQYFQAAERNKVKGYDPTIIDDPAPYTVEIGKYQKYGELLKNSVDNYYPLREKIVFVMKDMACVEQALAMGAVVSASLKNSHLFEKS